LEQHSTSPYPTKAIEFNKKICTIKFKSKNLLV
jgi:hypothetical protein